MEKTGEEVVIEALIAMEDKTQQVEVDGPRVELLEPKHRVVRDQRGIIRDAFTRNTEFRHDPSGQWVELGEVLTTGHFAAHFAEAEVLWLSFQQGDRIELVGFRQQSVKRHTFFRGQKRVEHSRQALHFCRQCPPC